MSPDSLTRISFLGGTDRTIWTYVGTLDAAVEEDLNQGNDGVDGILVEDKESYQPSIAENIISCG